MESFEDIRDQTPKEIQIFIEKSFDIADEVDFILEKQGKNRAFLASSLDKNESEISKWLSGLHNLTIKSISKIEATLGETVISTPTQEMKKHEGALKSLQGKVKRMQNKIKQLDIENQRLKKVISSNVYFDRGDDYLDDTPSYFFSSKAPLKVGEREIIYLGSDNVQIDEWAIVTSERPGYAKKLLATDEYEKITT